MFLRLLASSVLCLVAFNNGCDRGADTSAQQEVVVYTALDRQFSEPILNRFEARTGIKVRAKYDTESTKTIGLVNQIRAERERPVCDVFWNNEILNTLRLKAEGLLQPVEIAEAQHYPVQFRDPAGYWFGFASRARVIIVNTELVPEPDRPETIRELTDPRWRGKVAIAKPLFGTTASHVACLFASEGPDAAQAWLLALKRNDVQIVSGNKPAAEMVGRGEIAVALTDTDDALIEVEAGNPVSIIFPSSENGWGTLLLPNTLSVVKDCPNPEGAAKLIEYLLSPEVEAMLAEGASGQIPLHPKTTARSRVMPDETITPMSVDFTAAAAAFADAAEFVETQFLE